MCSLMTMAYTLKCAFAGQPMNIDYPICSAKRCDMFHLRTWYMFLECS